MCFIYFFIYVMFIFFFFFFFFSSRRRHTRSLCDWSSDVCSSDLGPLQRYKIYPANKGAGSIQSGQLGAKSNNYSGFSQTAATMALAPRSCALDRQARAEGL